MDDQPKRKEPRTATVQARWDKLELVYLQIQNEHQKRIIKRQGIMYAISLFINLVATYIIILS